MTRRGLLAGLAALGGAAACGRVSTPTGEVEVPAPRPGTPEPRPLTYGPDPAQFGVLHLPPGTGPVPVAVVVHGGYWRAAYGLDLGTPLAVDLTNRGVAAWNIEYRRVGAGGGWPATFTDVAAAVDLLTAEVQEAAGGRLDLDRVVLLGHSAGGHLATWAASRERLRDGSVAAAPRVRPVGTVAQAGVLDLVAAAEQGLGGGAVVDLLGGTPATVADRYALGSPAALVPAAGPVVCVHGDADTVVPLDQSQRYLAAATAARGEARLRVLPGVDHFGVIDPAHPAWTAVREEVEGLL
ncbi:alpha/beta hydrolase family protein [Actinomycetospora cinnamomea]|uniref:alpha/beta hydrolase family protein n=1 Tax=Actinomycetospora cinnamomea TaxID=663609 RepID=UPI001FAF3093|nr:alpha/beta hydrolase [Actinomycetospora cinnamomea]